MIRCWSYFYNIKPSAYPNQRWVLLHLEKVSYHIPLLVVISCQREHCQYISCDDSHATLIILITRVTTMTVVKYNILNNNKTLTATMTVAGYNEPKGKPWIRIMNCAVKSQFRLSSLACLEVKKKDYFRSALFPGFLNDLHFSNWAPLMHNIYPTDLGSCETLFGCAFETSPQKSVMNFRFFNYSWLYFGYYATSHSTFHLIHHRHKYLFENSILKKNSGEFGNTGDICEHGLVLPHNHLHVSIKIMAWF